MIKKTLKLSGLHCSSCAMLVEGELEDIGVDARCNWAKQMVDMQYEEGKVKDSDIQQAVARAGYRVVE